MKFTNDYEKIFVTAGKAIQMTDKLERVVNVLRQADKPLSAKDIGIALMGNAYTSADNWRDGHCARSLSSYLGRVLPMLAHGGLVKRSYVKGEPRTFLEDDWIRVSDNGEPEKIKVWDAEGHEYLMPNPNYSYYNSHIEYRKVERTVIPDVKVWEWVGG